jgi:hypothetical protein
MPRLGVGVVFVTGPSLWGKRNGFPGWPGSVTGRKTLDAITITDRKADGLPFSSRWPPAVFRALAAIRLRLVGFDGNLMGCRYSPEY